MAWFDLAELVRLLYEEGFVATVNRVAAKEGQLPRTLVFQNFGWGDEEGAVLVEALRYAAEAFFGELNASHTFATGGSTSGEVWLPADRLGDAISHLLERREQLGLLRHLPN